MVLALCGGVGELLGPKTLKFLGWILYAAGFVHEQLTIFWWWCFHVLTIPWTLELIHLQGRSDLRPVPIETPDCKLPGIQWMHSGGTMEHGASFRSCVHVSLY